MYVRNFILLLCVILFSSCLSSKKISKKTTFKGDVAVCNSDNEKFKFFVQHDSVSVNFKLYADLGIKVADIMVTRDSSYVRHAYNAELEKSINFYLQKYHNSLCLDSLILDFFSEAIYNKNVFCYQVEKVSSDKKRFFYNIYNLNQERLLSIEKVSEKSSKQDSYRIFNESFCIKVYLK